MQSVIGPTTWGSARWILALAGSGFLAACGQPLADDPDTGEAQYDEEHEQDELEQGYDYMAVPRPMQVIPGRLLAGNQERPMAEESPSSPEFLDEEWVEPTSGSTASSAIASSPGYGASSPRYGASSARDVSRGSGSAGAAATCPSSWCDDGDLGTLDVCTPDDGAPRGFSCTTEFDETAAGAPCRSGRHCWPDGRIHRECPQTGGSCPRWWCNDVNACTVDICENDGATCRHESTSCDDNDPCTEDACDPLLGCRHTPLTETSCYDGPSETRDVGQCASGFRTCGGGDSGMCNSQILPTEEVCNGLDDDCDGETDEPGARGCTRFYRDEDGDGFGQTGESHCLCEAAPPWSAQRDGDCNDGTVFIQPGADEWCGDLVDGDCDGTIDEGCPTLP